MKNTKNCFLGLHITPCDLDFRDIGSPAPNFDTRIFSFGSIPPEMALNEICFVFPGKIVFVDLF